MCDARKGIPAINAYGFYSLDKNNFVSFSEATEEEREWLVGYKHLIYNGVFDAKNKNKVFFGE